MLLLQLGVLLRLLVVIVGVVITHLSLAVVIGTGGVFVCCLGRVPPVAPVAVVPAFVVIVAGIVGACGGIVDPGGDITGGSSCNAVFSVVAATLPPRAAPVAAAAAARLRIVELD